MRPISGAARLAGVMGWPVAHSRSPLLHGFWLESFGIDGVYVPLAVRPERLATALRALPALGFRGVSLTAPHKEASIASLDRLAPQAQRIGSVNMVLVDEEGALEGRNTDVFGFRENLKSEAPQWRADQGPVVVLGAGGASRAVATALVDEGVAEIRLVNRSRERAERLAKDIGGPFRLVDWRERHDSLAGAALLVNTTSLGMTDQPPLELDLSALPLSAVVNDVVYAPLETPLIAKARQRGHCVVGGLGMLLHQGRPAFAAWFGPEPQVTPALREFVLAGA